MVRDHERLRAALGSLVFLVLVPGTIAGLFPWLITRWRAGEGAPSWLPARVLGVVLIVAGAAVLLDAFVRFVRDGIGTPAPVAPPGHLVVTGPYRYVRNPMYVAVASVIVGQALLLARPVLLLYAAAFLAVVGTFVLVHEQQPTLRTLFGDEYDAYCRAVPAWRPRRHSYRGDSAFGGPRPAT